MNRPRPLFRLHDFDFGMPRPAMLDPDEASSAASLLVVLGLVFLAIAAAGSITVAIWFGSVLRHLLGG